MAELVSAKAFVETLQSSGSLSEVAQKLKMKRSAARLRAFRYRGHGVPLKGFPPAPLPVVDWQRFTVYAERVKQFPHFLADRVVVNPLMPTATAHREKH
jgi:hypothetical protein